MSNENVKGNKPRLISPIKGGNVERNKFTSSFLGVFFLIIGVLYLSAGVFSLIGSFNAPDVTINTPYRYVGEISSLMLTISAGLTNLLIGISSLWLQGRKKVIRMLLVASSILLMGLLLSLTIPDKEINFKDWATQRYGIEEISNQRVLSSDTKIIYEENKLATIHQNDDGSYLLYDADDKEELPLKK